VKSTRLLPNRAELVANVDAVGQLDGRRCLTDSRATSSRYQVEPYGQPALDPQNWLRCVDQQNSRGGSGLARAEALA